MIQIGILDREGCVCLYYTNKRGTKKQYVGQHAVDTVRRMGKPKKLKEILELQELCTTLYPPKK